MARVNFDRKSCEYSHNRSDKERDDKLCGEVFFCDDYNFFDI